MSHGTRLCLTRYATRVNELTEAETAWLAGMYEGEGSCSFNATNNAWIVAISGKDYDVIRRLQALTGIGTIYERKRDQPGWSDILTWNVARRGDLFDFLTAIHPWLGERRKARAEQCLEHLSGLSHLSRAGMCRSGVHPKPDPGPCKPCAARRQREWRARQ